MMKSANTQPFSAAAQLMAIEVISELLVSTSPHKLGEVLTEHLRELTGARTVMVLAHRPEPEPDFLLNASPIRRATLFSPDELNNFCHAKNPKELPLLLDDLPAEHPIKNLLERNGIRSMARYPLRGGGELIGLLLLFDLPDPGRIAEINQIITLLAPLIALALKNALVFQMIEQQALELEKRVEERTAELRQKNAELLQSEEKHRAILLTAMDGFWLVDLDGRLLEVNETYCRMSGYSEQELLAMRIDDLEAVETKDESASHIQKIIALGEDRFETRHRHKNGSIFDVEVSVQYRPSDGGRLVAFLQDISWNRQMGHSLKLSEERYRLLTESVAAIPWEFDIPQNRWTYVGPQVERILGYAPDEWTTLEWWLDLIHPEDKTWVPGFCSAFTARGEEHSMEYRLLSKNGSSVWVNDLVTVEMLEGQPVKMRGIMLDITERKRAEEEKAKLEAQLQQSQKMESVGRLAGGVAHDFNNMLGVILGHAELALMKTNPSQPLYANITEILKAAERSADLTRQLLAFARKQTIVPKVLDLNEVVEGMIKMLQRLIGEDIHLAWQPAADLWPVKLDSSQVDQILANLCVNARDAIGGVGKLTIETGNSTFDADYCAVHAEVVPGDYVLLAVSDDGCGMDKETQFQVFEPFFTTKGIGEGTGLGLSTVYGAVKQNNGFINVYSEPGQGTTFSIYLPRHAGKIGKTLIADTPEPSSHGQETILLVEDELSILKMTTLMLEKQGYTVLAANTPSEAIRLFEEHAREIQLLITDVVMPEMNGRELARKLLSLDPHLKRLFMSGYTAEVIAHHGVLEKGVHFIQKPFSMNDLSAKLHEVLSSE